MARITLYTRQGCHLCGAARAVLERTGFHFEAVDIDGDPELRALYDLEVPVIAIDGRPVFRGAVDFDALIQRLK